MKISVLLEREPFDKIFEETLSSFLSERFRSAYTVSWKKKKLIPVYKKFTQQWLCNPLINSIYVVGANHDIFDSINGEYSSNPMRPWLSELQKFYLTLAQNKFAAPILSAYRIDITPPIKDPNNKLIIGGNTKIRFIDAVEGRVYVILKKGFERKYIDKELYARENFKHLDIPKLYHTGKKAIWYSEEYISGISPNRLERAKGLKALNKVVDGIHQMLNATKAEQRLSNYMSGLEQRVLTGLEKIPNFQYGERVKLTDFVQKLLCELNKYADNSIITAYCHGDFHQGNILCDGDKNWILDWENSGQKQIGYDLFILLLESRIANGFHMRFSKLLNHQFDSSQNDIINNWPELNWKNKDSKKISLLLFLIEEIDFHVAENNNGVFFNNSNEIIQRFNELMKCFESINLLKI